MSRTVDLVESPRNSTITQRPLPSERVFSSATTTGRINAVITADRLLYRYDCSSSTLAAPLENIIYN